MRPSLPPPHRAPLHTCASPITHSCLAWSGVGGVLVVWWLTLGWVGRLLRAWLIPGVAPLDALPVWGLTLLIDAVWAFYFPIFGGTMAHTMVMGSCNRALERLAQWQATPPVTGGRPVVVERVYLDADGARQLGLDGAVILERVYDPRTLEREACSC